jgi:integrase
VGEALWAARQIKASNKTKFAFPEYTNAELCNANSASAALNRWVQTNISKDYVIHSLRHSMRDRLREVQCPAEIIDQIGGWSSRSIGECYGEGYSIYQLKKWITLL